MKYTDSNKPLVCMQTQSSCYKGTTTMTVRGVLWHSTGANNPNLKRYVQPSDNKPANDTYSKTEWLKLLGENTNKNSLNQKAEDIGLNAWIGKLADGTVTSIQTMPWNYRPWGCGGGCNNGWIQFEICEDGLTDTTYFNKVYKEACELTAYLCKMYSINPKSSVTYNGKSVPTILCHYDSYLLGLGSNHGDVYNWFDKYGKTMENVRSDVASLLNGANFTLTPEDSDGTSSSTTGSSTVVSTEPVEPIEPVLIKNISLVDASFDSAKVRLTTSDSYSSYNWSYITSCLQTSYTSAEHSFSVSGSKTDLVIKNLLPNNSYMLTIIATTKDSNKNKTVVPGFILNTKQSYPSPIKNVTFNVTGDDITKMNCKISFSPPSSWGSFNSAIADKGYRVSLFVNGIERGYSDTFITKSESSKSLTLKSLLTTLKVHVTVNYMDIIQISILPWIKDTQNCYIFAQETARCSPAIQLKYASNIYTMNKLYLNTSNGFKRIALFNFSK